MIDLRFTPLRRLMHAPAIPLPGQVHVDVSHTQCMLHTPPRIVYTFQDCCLVVVSTRLRLPVRACTIRGAYALAHKFQQALLLPDRELPVLRGLARGALVLLDGGRLLAVRRRAERVSGVWPEVECGAVRHDLGGGAEHDMSAPAAKQCGVASARARGTHPIVPEGD